MSVFNQTCDSSSPYQNIFIVPRGKKKLRKPGSLGSQKIFKNRGFDRQFEILVLTENVYTTAENRDYGLKSHGQFLISDSGSR